MTLEPSETQKDNLLGEFCHMSFFICKKKKISLNKISIPDSTVHCGILSFSLDVLMEKVQVLSQRTVIIPITNKMLKFLKADY